MGELELVWVGDESYHFALSGEQNEVTDWGVSHRSQFQDTERSSLNWHVDGRCEVKGWGKVSGRKLWRNSLGGAEGRFAPLSPKLKVNNVEIGELNRMK